MILLLLVGRWIKARLSLDVVWNIYQNYMDKKKLDKNSDEQYDKFFYISVHRENTFG